jgi:hypothetical protein
MEFTVVDANSKSLKLELELDEVVVEPDEIGGFGLEKTLIEKIRMTKLFPNGTRFKFYFVSRFSYADEDEFPSEHWIIADAFEAEFNYYPEDISEITQANLYVKGYSIEGEAEKFLPVPYKIEMQRALPNPMIKSANKTASARMIKEALVLHKGNVQKAADWVSKRQQKE